MYLLVVIHTHLYEQVRLWNTQANPETSFVVVLRWADLKLLFFLLWPLECWEHRCVLSLSAWHVIFYSGS